MLVSCGKTPTDWITTSIGKNLIWPLADVEEMVDALEIVYNDRKENGIYIGKTRERIDAAYTWALQNTWEIVGSRWLNLFSKLYEK